MINIRYIQAISQASSGFELCALKPHLLAHLSDPLVSLAHIVVLFFSAFPINGMPQCSCPALDHGSSFDWMIYK